MFLSSNTYLRNPNPVPSSMSSIQKQYLGVTRRKRHANLRGINVVLGYGVVDQKVRKYAQVIDWGGR